MLGFKTGDLVLLGEYLKNFTGISSLEMKVPYVSLLFGSAQFSPPWKKEPVRNGFHKSSSYLKENFLEGEMLQGKVMNLTCPRFPGGMGGPPRRWDFRTAQAQILPVLWANSW